VDPIEVVLELTGSGLVPKGDTLFFNTLIQNTTENPIAGDHWLSVELPNTSEIEIPDNLLNYSNPLSGQVPALGSVNLTNELYIPMGVPTGSYKLKGRVGIHPNTAIDEWWIDFMIAE